VKTTRQNFNRNCKLHEICGGDDWRPEHSFIYFSNGFAYATDAHILIKARISDISTLKEDQIALLDGKCIHHSFYSKVIAYNKIEVIPDGIKVEIPESNGNITFAFSNKIHGVVDDIEKVLASAKREKQTTVVGVGINPSLLFRLYNGFGLRGNGIELVIKAIDKAILVRPTDGDSVGLIMPIMINR
jgi:hypothetical protein